MNKYLRLTPRNVDSIDWMLSIPQICADHRIWVLQITQKRGHVIELGFYDARQHVAVATEALYFQFSTSLKTMERLARSTTDHDRVRINKDEASLSLIANHADDPGSPCITMVLTASDRIPKPLVFYLDVNWFISE